MPGEKIVLLGDSEGRLRSFVTALERFPTEPEWVVVGGFAVNVRVSYAHRLTNDLDTLTRDQTAFVDILVEMPGSEPVVGFHVASVHSIADLSATPSL